MNTYRIFTKIELGANKDDWSVWTVMRNLREPFCSHIFEWSRWDEWKTNEENIRLWVRKRTKSVRGDDDEEEEEADLWSDFNQNFTSIWTRACVCVYTVFYFAYVCR